MPFTSEELRMLEYFGINLPVRKTGDVKYLNTIIQCTFCNRIDAYMVKMVGFSDGSWRMEGVVTDCDVDEQLVEHFLIRNDFCSIKDEVTEKLRLLWKTEEKYY